MALQLLDRSVILPPRDEKEKAKSQICINCNNLKDHTKHDTFCLELNGWTPEELENASKQTRYRTPMTAATKVPARRFFGFVSDSVVSRDATESYLPLSLSIKEA
jgi:hypothetical protein